MRSRNTNLLLAWHNTASQSLISVCYKNLLSIFSSQFCVFLSVPCGWTHILSFEILGWKYSANAGIESHVIQQIVSNPQQFDSSQQVWNWNSCHDNFTSSLNYPVLSLLKHCLETSVCESPCLYYKCAEAHWRDFIRILCRLE